MNDSLIIGQYVPTQSMIHRVDPRTKIMIIFVYVIIVFFANNILSYGVLTGFAALTVLLTKIPIRFILKGLTPIWFLIIFTFLLHVFVNKTGTVYLELFTYQFYTGGLIQGFAISMRFFLLILVTSLLTLTTTPMEITDALEMMLHPLKKIKLPIHEIALMMSISLRFIPTLMQETGKISKAQASRGVDFKTGPIKHRVKAIVPLLIPLFVSAFKRAEELAMAMESRGYSGGEGRSKLRELQFKKHDLYVCLAFVVVLIVLFISRAY